MSVFSALACALNYHAPVRRHVTWDGRNYVGNCRHCRHPIERQSHRIWHKRPVAADQQAGPPSR